MPYTDDYKAYLRGKTVPEMGKGVLDVDHMTDSQICTAMGYVLLKEDDPNAKDRPFFPTHEEYNFVAARVAEKKTELERKYRDYEAEYKENTNAKAAAITIGRDSIPSARNEKGELLGEFSLSILRSGIEDKKSAINYLLGMYQKDSLHYAGKEAPEENGYSTLPGPKLTHSEKEMLKEKARLHANPPVRPSWWKYPLNAIGKIFNKDWFQEEIDAYDNAKDRFSRIDSVIDQEHRNAAPIYEQESRDYEARKQQEAKLKEVKKTQPEVQENKPQKDIIEDQQQKIQEQPQKDIIGNQPQIREQPQEPSDPTTEYLNGYLRSAEKLRESGIENKNDRLLKLAELGIASVKSIKHHLDPEKNPPVDENELKILDGKRFNDKDFGESLRCLGVFQMFATPVYGDFGGELSPLYENIHMLGGIGGVLSASKEIFPVGSEGLSKDVLKSKVDDDESIFVLKTASDICDRASQKMREQGKVADVGKKVNEKNNNNSMHQ